MTALQAALNTKTKVLIFLSLIATYFIWGSTFLAIRFAIETIPPLMMASTRFLLAGTILYLIARRIDATPLESSRVKRALLTGMLMPGIGNGLVTLAEQTIPSGIAALWNSAIPLWMMLFNWMSFERKRPDGVSFLGAGVGILGVGVLAESSNGNQIFGLGMLWVASISWCIGSLIQRQDPVKTQPFKISAVQMFGGGLFQIVTAFVLNEPAQLMIDTVTAKSFLSMLYLSIFGSVVAFTAFSWLLTQLSPEKATTYALVNPLVALALGYWFASETIHPQILLSASLVLAGVGLILFKDPIKRLVLAKAEPPQVHKPKLAIVSCEKSDEQLLR